MCVHPVLLVSQAQLHLHGALGVRARDAAEHRGRGCVRE